MEHEKHVFPLNPGPLSQNFSLGKASTLKNFVLDKDKENISQKIVKTNCFGENFNKWGCSKTPVFRNF
jgi:hypothetical protein